VYVLEARAGAGTLDYRIQGVFELLTLASLYVICHRT